MSHFISNCSTSIIKCKPGRYLGSSLARLHEMFKAYIKLMWSQNAHTSFNIHKLDKVNSTPPF